MNLSHPLVVQLRFTRSEFSRALVGLNDAGARHRFPPMNSISWVLGHLASAEQKIWLTSMQGQTPYSHLDELYGYEQPASTPPLTEMREAWQTITRMADPLLDTLTTPMLQTTNVEFQRTTGSLLVRLIYHYWYHTGEIMAIRQLLGHSDLPEFVGDLDTQAPYVPH
jgi:uncharacterized damage-inducible protein DinB